MKTRRNALRMAAAAAVPVALTAVPYAASATPAPGGRSAWQTYELPALKGRAVLSDVATMGRNDAWAAGFEVSDDTGPDPILGQPPLTRPRVKADDCNGRDSFPSMMLRWNGRAWSKVAVPRMGRINAVSASTAKDAWASTDCGLLHWDGKSWTPTDYGAIPGARQSSPTTVKTVNEHEAWLVGDFDTKPDEMRGFVQRWDGRRWTNIALPDLGTYFSLNSIDARGPNDVWAVGTDYDIDYERPEGLIFLHWDGRAWKQSPAPKSDQWTKRLSSVRIMGPNDVWATGMSKVKPDGDELRRPLLMHWNGREWATTPSPAERGDIFDLARDGSGLLAVGDTFSPGRPPYEGLALRWDGKRWGSDTLPATGELSISGVESIPGGGVWAVGGVGDDDHALPIIARRN
ncbi:hypothetical protein [Spirillospora sp. NBC_01491]|uniref:hypothetical protein n=1 Tax=Spirillospora sp. NBC_01491 TaxID=2976007 RepID=UPI002E311FC2|nr:hypothetical protein [Spirillospora sp. NBC_01491]